MATEEKVAAQAAHGLEQIGHNSGRGFLQYILATFRNF